MKYGLTTDCVVEWLTGNLNGYFSLVNVQTWLKRLQTLTKCLMLLLQLCSNYNDEADIITSLEIQKTPLKTVSEWPECAECECWRHLQVCTICIHLCRCVHVLIHFAHLRFNAAGQTPTLSSTHICTDYTGYTTCAPREGNSQRVVSL